MSYLALNEKILSRFSHHWFWGLTYMGKGHENTLYNAAISLQSNDSLRKKTEEHVIRIAQRNLVIRAICWFLNLGQYRAHYYQVEAYYSWQMYQKGHCMFSGNDLAYVNIAGAFIVTAGAVLATTLVSPYLKQSSAWFREKMLSFFISSHNMQVLPETKITTPQREADDESLSLITVPLRLSSSLVATHVLRHNLQGGFTVTTDMLTHLEKLGIHGVVGKFIPFEELKLAYRENRRLTHPDKGKSIDTTAFVVVTNAYEKLLLLIEGDLASKDCYSNSGMSLSEVLNKMRQEIHVMHQETVEMTEGSDQMLDEMRQVAADYRRMTEETKVENDKLAVLVAAAIERKRQRALARDMPVLVVSGGQSVNQDGDDSRQMAVSEAANTHRFFVLHDKSDGVVNPSTTKAAISNRM